MRKSYFIGFLLIGALVCQGVAQSVENLQQKAVAQHPAVLAAYKEFEASLQRVAQVGNLANPRISMGAFLQPIETRVGAQQVRLSLSQQFPWFGKLKAEKQVATLQTEIYYQSFLEAQHRVMYEVANAYYPLFELKRKIELEKRNLKLLASYKSVATQKFENGKGTMVDVLRADLMMKEASTNLELLQLEYQKSKTNLNVLLGSPSSDTLVLADSLELPTDWEIPNIDSLFEQIPQVKALVIAKEVEEAKKTLAMKKSLPSFGVGLDYAVIQPRTDLQVPDNGKDAIMPMVSVSVPIFRKQYQAASREATLKQEAISLKEQDYRQQLVAKMAVLQLEMEQQLKQYRHYQQQLITIQQSLNLLLTAYANTNSGFEEVLAMQQKSIEYERKVASVLTDWYLKKAMIDYLVGNMKVESGRSK